MMDMLTGLAAGVITGGLVVWALRRGSATRAPEVAGARLGRGVARAGGTFRL
jgi:hypothetical protein